MYSMAESYMIPRVFTKLHKKHKTPVTALLLIGLLSVAAPFLGRKMLVWIVDAGNFGCCLAYCMVAVSFLILRSKEPDIYLFTIYALDCQLNLSANSMKGTFLRRAKGHIIQSGNVIGEFE